jgi:hypothetical protein
VTTPAIVLATAVPTRSAPSMLKVAETTTAWPGRAPRVATSVAIAFAASWNPFVSAKASAIATASQTAMTPHAPFRSAQSRTKENRRAGCAFVRFPEELSFPTASRRSFVLLALRARRWHQCVTRRRLCHPGIPRTANQRLGR